MRLCGKLLLIASALALLTAPASAAVSPMSLVLQKADLPPGYKVLRANTGRLTNAKAAQGNRDLLRAFGEWRRFDGFSVEYDGRFKGNIASRIDLFRHARGSAAFLAWSVKATPKWAGIPFVRREPGLGDAAYVFRKDFGTSVFIVVEWRYRNVCGHVSADNLGIRRTIALARVQQRKIAAALR